MMRALAMDGGGFRGLVTAAWLEYLDEHLARPLTSYFDVVAGTSAGSLNALALASGMSGRGVKDQFLENGRLIFPNWPVRLCDKIARIPSEGISSPRYGAKRIENILQSTFGDRVLGDAEVRTLVPVYSMTEARALVLDSHKPQHADVPMWLAARASTAAPTYFPATTIIAEGKEHVVVDGGVAVNQPALAASATLRNDHHVEFEDIVVVSLGTGRPPTNGDLESLQGAGLLDWGMTLVQFLLEAPSDHVNYLCRRLHGDNYHRIEVEVAVDKFSIDDASSKMTTYLLNRAESVFPMLDPLIQVLDDL